MKMLPKNKLITLAAIASIIFSGCAGGPNTRACRFDDRVSVEKRLLCYNAQYDFDANGDIKPSRKYKNTYILKALRGYLMVPPGADETNLRRCVRKLRVDPQASCSD